MQYSNQYGAPNGAAANGQWAREPGWNTPKESTPGPMGGPVMGVQNGGYLLAQPNYSTMQVQQQQMIPAQQLAVAAPMVQNVQAQYIQQQHQQYRLSEIPQQQYVVQQEMAQVPVIVQEVQMIQEVVPQPVYYQQPVHIQEVQEVVYIPEPARRAPTPQRAPALRERAPPPPPPEQYRERQRERAMSPPPPPPEPEIKYVDRYVEVPVDRVINKEIPVEVEKIVVKEVPVEKVITVYQDVPVEKKVLQDVPVEKVVFKEIPVEVEKIVTREVPVAVEKVVVKEVQIPVEKLVERVVEKIVERPVEKVVYQDREKIVYQDRIVYQDKIVYQDRIVEVPVERTVAYENPREGGYQITSGKYQVADQRNVQVRESLASAKYPTVTSLQRDMVSYVNQPVDHVVAQIREQSLGNVSTLGSTNHVRETERSVYRERSSSAFPSPPKAGGKKIGLGLKLKRNAAGYTYVQEIIPGFAAHKQGQVQVDDIVIAVDHEPVEGWDLDAIKQLTMGDENTFCTLLIKRDTQYLQITLQRCFPDVVDEQNMAAYSSLRSIS